MRQRREEGLSWTDQRPGMALEVDRAKQKVSLAFEVNLRVSSGFV